MPPGTVIPAAPRINTALGIRAGPPGAEHLAVHIGWDPVAGHRAPKALALLEQGQGVLGLVATGNSLLGAAEL